MFCRCCFVRLSYDSKSCLSSFLQCHVHCLVASNGCGFPSSSTYSCSYPHLDMKNHVIVLATTLVFMTKGRFPESHWLKSHGRFRGLRLASYRLIGQRCLKGNDKCIGLFSMRLSPIYWIKTLCINLKPARNGLCLSKSHKTDFVALH